MLDIFDIKLGPDAKMPVLDADSTGLVAVQLLDAIQTIVNVLTDTDSGKGYDVSFTNTLDAYTDRSAKRQIVVSAKPMLDANPGDSLVQVCRVMTGFAVHEIGHTKMDFFTAVKNRWPGKQLPLTLANIIEDVVLEARTVVRYPGFADVGEGNIFHPTLEWVASETCPKTPLKWSGSTGHKVNVTGQIVRYRPFVTFADDAVTQAALTWVSEWAEGITPAIGPMDCVDLIERWLDYVKATMKDDIVEDEPEPDIPDFPTGSSTSQTLPNEDTEPGEGEGEGEGGDTEGEDNDDDGTEGEGDSDDADADDDGGTTEGGDEDGGDGESEGPGERGGDGNDADTMDRTDLGQGEQDKAGAGGSGQGVSEASPEGTDPLDDDTPDPETPKSFDDMAKPESGYQQRRLDDAVEQERRTTRVDAGAHGKMRVIFR